MPGLSAEGRRRNGTCQFRSLPFLCCPTRSTDKLKPRSRVAASPVGLRRRGDVVILISRSTYIGATSLTSARAANIRVSCNAGPPCRRNACARVPARVGAASRLPPAQAIPSLPQVLLRGERAHRLPPRVHAMSFSFPPDPFSFSCTPGRRCERYSSLDFGSLCSDLKCGHVCRFTEAANQAVLV